MKVILVTAFPEKFVKNRVLPDLERRVQVLEVVRPEKADHIDFAGRPDLVLHMTEFGSHSFSEKLSKVCRTAGVGIRSLSRKKASWSFLPAPQDGRRDDSEGEIELPPVEEEIVPESLEREARGRELKAAREIAGMNQETLAKVLGIAQSTISRYELGKAFASDEYAAKVLKACGLAPGWRGLVKQQKAEEATMMSNGSHVQAANSVPAVLPPIDALIDQTEEDAVQLRAVVTQLRFELDAAKFAIEKAVAEAAAEKARAEKAEGMAESFRRHVNIIASARTLFEEGILTEKDIVEKVFLAHKA